MTLNENIKKLRVARGLNQVDFAKRMGVSKQCVSNWENDNIQPSIEMLIRLSNLFRVSTDYLLGLDCSTIINADGLPVEFVSHITQIIDDYKNK